MFFVIGIILSFFLDFLLISKKRKTLADKILAAWLFFLGIHLLLFYLIYVSKQFLAVPWLLGIELPMPLLHGPFLYLYTAALTNQFHYKKKFMLLHFVPVIVTYLYMFRFLALPSEQKVVVYQNKGAGFEVLTMINISAIILSGVIYIIWSIILLRKYNRSLFDQFSYTEKINLKWLQYLIYGISVIWLFVIFGNSELIFGSVVFFILFIGYFGIKQVGIFTSADYNFSERNTVVTKTEQAIQPKIEEELVIIKETPVLEVNETAPQYLSDKIIITEDTADKRKYSKSGLTETGAANLHKALSEIMKTEKLFSESELSLSELAGRLQTHPNYLSQIINELEGKNFYEYINTLRIEEFKRLIANPDNQKFTILSLAYECGFNSKSSFNRYFKKSTGQSPSEYLRNLNIEEVLE